MIFTFKINHQKVMQEVAKQTAYIATHRDDGTAAVAYDRIATTDQSEEILSSYLLQAVDLLRNALVRYMAGEVVPGDDGNIVFPLDMPENWDKKKANLEDTAYLYVVDYILSQWLTIVDGKRSEQYAKSAATKLIMCQIAANLRKRPIRYE